MMVSFNKKRLQIKHSNSLQLLVTKFAFHSLSVFHKHRIPSLKQNYAHVIHGPNGSQLMDRVMV